MHKLTKRGGNISIMFEQTVTGDLCSDWIQCMILNPVVWHVEDLKGEKGIED